MKTALAEVKEELGPEAVIMSNKKVTGGIEIVAAVDSADMEPAVKPDRAAAPISLDFGQPQSRSSSRSLAEDSVSISSTAKARPQEAYSKNPIRPAVVTKNKASAFSDMLNHFEPASSTHTSSQKRTRPTYETRSEEKARLKQERQKLDMQNQRSYSRRQESVQDYDENLSLLGREALDWASGQASKRESAVNRNERNLKRNLGKYQDPYSKADQIRQELEKSSRHNLPPLSRSSKKTNYTAPRDAEMESMRSEMASIRELLEHQLSGLMRQEVERKEPLRAMLIERLEKMGFSTDIADQLAYYIPENTVAKEAWSTVLSILADQVLTVDKYDIESGGIIALLGPTGVGKTTTIAKLAARVAMEFGPDEVALVTTDTFRIGAHEQLATYGRIMGCPVKIAKDADELSDVLHQFRHRRFVLVDTAGMGQRDIRLQEQLDTLIQNSGEHIQSYLVLPATAQRRVLQETIDQFKRIPLSGCVLSKLDESLSLGELISVTIQNALPIAYLADGQRVPEDLRLASGQYLVEKADSLLQQELEQSPHFLSTDPSDIRANDFYD